MNLREGFDKLVTVGFFSVIAVLIFYSAIMLFIATYFVFNCDKLPDVLGSSRFEEFVNELNDEILFSRVFSVILAYPALLMFVIMVVKALKRREVYVAWRKLPFHYKLYALLIVFVGTEFGLVFFTFMNYFLINETIYVVFKRECVYSIPMLVASFLVNALSFVIFFVVSTRVLRRRWRKKFV